MPLQLPTVFISSTFRDLAEHRNKVIAALLRAEVWPLAMELFHGDAAPPLEYCLKVLDKADACFIVVGNSYGSRPPRRQRSYTHLEYEHARKRAIPIRVFTISESESGSSDGGEEAEELVTFKHKLSRRHTLVSFNSPDDLATKFILELKDLWKDLQPGSTSSNVISPNRSSLERLFTQATESLRSWPQTLVNNEWIERPELPAIEAIFNSRESSVTVLLGTPGAGKSSLLARLCRRSAEAGMIVLGIKADELPTEVEHMDGIAQYLHMPTSTDKAITLIATQKRVLLAIDQLDALADLMDLKTGRLNAVLELVHACADIPRVHIVCSCRELEFARDARFRSFSAEQFRLQLPSWDRVNCTLRVMGITDADQWPEKFRSILQTPQHLDIFLRRHQETGSIDVFTSYQAMLDDVWQRKINSPAKQNLIYDFTRYSMKNETQWAPLVRYEQQTDLVQALVADGIFDERRVRVGFRHQTMLEHARARLFTRTGESLLEHVLPRQDGLSVRPTLWATLTYLREADWESYQRAISDLLGHGLRLHLRHLLIDFLGMQEAPHEFELGLMSTRLQSLEDRKRVLIAIRGRKTWFDTFCKLHVPSIATWPKEDLWPLVLVIQDAWSFAVPQCFEIIDRYFLPKPERDELTWRAMQELSEWDQQGIDRLRILIKRAAPGRVWWAEDFTYLVSQHNPTVAPRVVSAVLQRLIEVEPGNAKGELSGRRRSPLENSQEWYELPAVAEEAPTEFMREVWPGFVQLANTYDLPCMSSVLNLYETRAWYLDPDCELNFHYPLIEAVELSVVQCARLTPEAFLEITRPTWSSESGLVQVMIARGLTECAIRNPEAILDYLSTDPRRLSLCCPTRGQEYYSRELIRSLSIHLTGPQHRQLEGLIRNWSQYHHDVKLCESQVEWDREARLRLLAAIPDHCRSSELAAFIIQETNELPDAFRKPVRFRSGRVTDIPSMTKDEMRSATDDAIVEALLIPADENTSQWVKTEDDLTRFGGGEAACVELCELAKENPHRGLSLASMLLERGLEDAASQVLNALTDSNLTDEEVFAFFSRMNMKQFRSEIFRRQASYVLYRRCRSEIGLPQHLCDLLREWLLQEWAPDASPLNDGDVSSDKGPESVLWRSRGGLIDSDHSFFVFEALTSGLLMRKPPDCATWLSVLNNHLQRHPSPRAWRSYCTELRWLSLDRCNNDETVALIQNLFRRLPQVRDSIDGVGLIANISYVLPPGLILEVLDQWRQSPWLLAAQARTELLTLLALRDEEHAWARDYLDTQIDQLNVKEDPKDEEFAIGAAFVAARLWDEPDSRPGASELLLRLIPHATAKVATAISTVFWASENFPADEITERLLVALANYPQVIIGHAVADLMEHLVSLVSYQRQEVLRLCQAILASCGRDLANISSELYSVGPHLVSIAMTLQRYQEMRSASLDLFEKLLQLGVADAFQCLDEIDLRPISIHRRSPPPRRRRRRT